MFWRGGEVMKVFDPVCKMTIEDRKAAATSAYNGNTFFSAPSHASLISIKTLNLS